MSELTHYGVKGMRWGIRRKRPTTYAERRARTKRALKIAGAVAGGAALGYIGYKNRGALANYSSNRFSDAQRFARRNATRAGMTARAYGSMAAQGARSGYGYVRNVSSNRMEDARRSARRNLTKAGMRARNVTSGYGDFGRAVGGIAKQTGREWREYGQFLNDRRKASQKRKAAIQEVRKVYAHQAAVRQYGDRKPRDPALLKTSRTSRHTNFVNPASLGKNNVEFAPKKSGGRRRKW